MTKELEIFSSTWFNKAFERTYGWAWLLKLQQELLASPLDDFKGYSKILKPLADRIAEKFGDFLPSLVYPQRVGTHTNSAFGLIFAAEYAQSKQEASKIQIFKAKGKDSMPLSYHLRNERNLQAVQVVKTIL